MKKLFALALALMMVLSVMSFAAAEETITLRWVGAGWLNNNKAENIIAKWEAANPNIHVEYIDMGNTVDADYLRNLDTMIGGGEVVDVTYLTYNEVYNRVINGAALPLDEYIAAAGDDYNDMYGSLSTAMLTYNGSVYGVPYAGNTFKVFYNKDMFAAAGLEAPEGAWSIEQFTEYAVALNNPEAEIYGCVFPFTWSEIAYTPALLSGWTLVTKDEAGVVHPNFDNDVFKACFQWSRDLVEKYNVAPSLATMQAESLNRRQALATGKTAMIVDGPYTLVWLQNYMFNDPGEGPLSFELGVAELPYVTEEGSDVSFNTVAGAFYVPKTSAHPAEAYAFSKFVCNECMAEAANYMPIYKDADMAAATTSFTQYIDAAGNTHTEVYPLDTAIAAVKVPFEAYVGRYGYDPTVSVYNSLMATLFEEQCALFMNGEMDLNDWVDMMQQLGEAEIAAAN